MLCSNRLKHLIRSIRGSAHHYLAGDAAWITGRFIKHKCSQETYESVLKNLPVWFYAMHIDDATETVPFLSTQGWTVTGESVYTDPHYNSKCTLFFLTTHSPDTTLAIIAYTDPYEFLNPLYAQKINIVSEQSLSPLIRFIVSKDNVIQPITSQLSNHAIDSPPSFYHVEKAPIQPHIKLWISLYEWTRQQALAPACTEIPVQRPFHNNILVHITALANCTRNSPLDPTIFSHLDFLDWFAK